MGFLNVVMSARLWCGNTSILCVLCGRSAIDTVACGQDDLVFCGVVENRDVIFSDSTPDMSMADKLFLKQVPLGTS